MHSYPKIEQVDLPPASRLSSSYGQADFADAFSVDLAETAADDAASLARHAFAKQPEWIALLVKFRDLLVWPLGLKRSVDLLARQANVDERISFFRVFERHDHEVVLGENDKHLDFRVSVLVQPASQGRSRRLILTTLVFYNRPLGRAYIALIAPFHRRVVRATLDRAQQVGWPTA
ncbi:DUF2867 domain-containing protein [Paraburkholderia antibiotica]|uniref:DUF2867 domain-containing protein n=1 Tax=Paraburkholderia antibiotica TaxID=2728839 RepID=A0A7X9X6G9_9BURK|nr:DUF2867 domain-containing protein [Paraburkholderia antibiotica]NML32398.1 DUF2867 domain-containing protein [Paraburkholderia antibiotica]